MDLVIVDKKGNPITDIRKEEVTVTEDGTPRRWRASRGSTSSRRPRDPQARPRVSSNQRPENRTGRSFVVLFDDVHLTPFQASRAKGAVASFLETGASEGDLVTLVASSGAAWWTTRLPQGKDELMGMLKRLDGRYIPDMSPERMSDYEAMMIHVFRDQRTIERVNRRYDTFGVNPQGRRRRRRAAATRTSGPTPTPRSRAAPPRPTTRPPRGTASPWRPSSACSTRCAPPGAASR